MKRSARYVQLADDFWLEEMYPQADAVYKKALEADHNHDHSLWQLADIAARQGRPADARQYLLHLMDVRTLRGDERGSRSAASVCRRSTRLRAPRTASAPARSEVDLSDALADMGPEQ